MWRGTCDLEPRGRRCHVATSGIEHGRVFPWTESLGGWVPEGQPKFPVIVSNRCNPLGVMMPCYRSGVDIECLESLACPLQYAILNGCPCPQDVHIDTNVMNGLGAGVRSPKTYSHRRTATGINGTP